MWHSFPPCVAFNPALCGIQPRPVWHSARPVWHSAPPCVRPTQSPPSRVATPPRGAHLPLDSPTSLRPTESRTQPHRSNVPSAFRNPKAQLRGATRNTEVLFSSVSTELKARKIQARKTEIQSDRKSKSRSPNFQVTLLQAIPGYSVQKVIE